MAKKKVAMLNPHSYERIDDDQEFVGQSNFYVGSRLVGHIYGSVELGYIWISKYGYQGWDKEQIKAIRRMRKIYWYETLSMWVPTH